MGELRVMMGSYVDSMSREVSGTCPSSVCSGGLKCT